MRWPAKVVLSLPISLLLWSSAALAAPPDVPGPCPTVIVTAPGQKGVGLDWAPVPPAIPPLLGYRVFRDGVLLATLGPFDLTWFDPEFPVRGDAQYCVEAFNADGASPRCCSPASATLSTVATVAGPDWYQDTFPWEETAGLPGTPAFAIKPAKIGSGRNIAPITNTHLRFAIPRGSALIHAPAPVSRVDLIFRIKPGPGNYDVVGVPGGGLIPFPDVPRPAALIAPGDGSFWSFYIADNGPFGTPDIEAHFPGPIWEVRWDPNTWNSAQCAPLGGGDYVTNYASAPAQQIIPDFLLTAGSHVEYFFRVTSPGGVFLIPDTSQVIQQDGERSIDGHRWAEFTVLPDLWKTAAFGGPGLAQTLVIDLCNGHGAERIWTGIADSTGATAPARFGANNGWRAIGGGADIDDPANNLREDGIVPGFTPGFTSAHLGAPGTTWDLFNVQGPDDVVNGYAGSIGARLAPRPGPGPLFGQESRLAPTPEMLRTYYRLIVMFSGDRRSGILGPLINRGQDDVLMLQDFLTNPAGSTRPRGIYVGGEGYAQSESDPTIPLTHLDLLRNNMGTILRNGDYRTLAGNLNPSAYINGAGIPGLHEVRLNGDPDVLMRNPAIAETMENGFFENIGVNGPYTASVYKPPTPLRNWVSMVDGWNLARHIHSGGRMAYIDQIFDGLFSGVAQVTTPGPVAVTPRPASAARLEVLGNPVHGPARIQFDLPERGSVSIDVLDTAGRRVTSLTSRLYEEGRWEVTWAATDATGRGVEPGVYFVRMLKDGVPVSSARMVFLR